MSSIDISAIEILASLVFVATWNWVAAKWVGRMTVGITVASAALLIFVLMNVMLTLKGNAATGMGPVVLWIIGAGLLVALDWMWSKSLNRTKPQSTTPSKT